MLSSEFAPASAVRTVARGYGGSTTLPAGINSRTLRSGDPVVGKAVDVASSANSTPLALKPVAAVAGVAGAVSAGEFLGPVAGWGLRKTVGKLPGVVGATAHNLGSIPAGPVNALYQARFGDLFTARGWKQFYANMMGTVDNYAQGGHVSMHGLEGEKSAGFWKGGRVGELPYVQGAAAKPKYAWGWNPLKGFKGELLSEGGQIVSDGRAWGTWSKEAHRFAGEGIAPKAFEVGAKVEGWGLKAIGQRIMNGRAMGVLLKGGLVAAVGLLGIKLTQHFAEQVSQAEKIHEDMTGEKIGAWRLLMNPKSLPPVTRHVRDSLIENAMPGAAQVAAEGLDKYAMADGLRSFKMLPMVAGQLLGRGVAEFKPSGDFVGSYHAVEQARLRSRGVPVEAYAALIEAASPDVRRAGGAKAPITLGLAAEYAATNMSAADVVKEIEAKTPFVERAKGVHAKLLAEQEAQQAKPAHDGPIVAHQPQPEVAVAQEPVVAMHDADKPTLKVAAKAIEAATEHQGRVADMQRQVGA